MKKKEKSCFVISLGTSFKYDDALTEPDASKEKK